MDWYNARSFKIHKFLLFWLAQTQIPVQMSGAGILTLNRPLMLRVSLSENDKNIMFEIFFRYSVLGIQFQRYYRV
jgi:hypothetical protein